LPHNPGLNNQIADEGRSELILESRKERTEEWHKWVNVPTLIVLGMIFVFTLRINLVLLPKAIIFANGATTFQLYFSVLAFLIMLGKTERFFNVIKYFGFSNFNK